MTNLSVMFVFFHPWIKEGNFCAFSFQNVNYLQCRAFTVIIDILFISNAENQNFRAVHRFLYFIQDFSCAVNAVFRHLIVNHHRAFNHRGMETVLSCFPRKIVWVKRNAVSAKTRTRVERLETIWFCFCRIHNFPHTDTHFIAQHGQLVYQTDVDIAVGIFQNLFHLCNCRTGYFINFSFQNSTIHRCNHFGGILTDCADYLRGVFGFVNQISRVNAFRREAEVEVLSAF